MWNIFLLGDKETQKNKRKKTEKQTQEAVPGLAGCGELSYPIYSCFSSEVLDPRSDQI